MSPTPDLKRAIAPQTPTRTEHRANGRYPITLELHYKLPNKQGAEQHGFGRTVNISTGGVLFEADARLPATGPIQLAMHWPHLLDGVVTLKLVMSGRIIRSDANAIAVKAEHHEFRTAGARFRKAISDHAGGQPAGQRVKRAS